MLKHNDPRLSKLDSYVTRLEHAARSRGVPFNDMFRNDLGFGAKLKDVRYKTLRLLGELALECAPTDKHQTIYHGPCVRAWHKSPVMGRRYRWLSANSEDQTLFYFGAPIHFCDECAADVRTMGLIEDWTDQ